jgi:N-methylhydantoinase A
VDVGGTFTDLAVWDAGRGTVVVHKLLTTPDDPTRAILEGLAALGPQPDGVVHGTTLVINALVERRGAATGLVTTDGFRDVLEIGNELRYDTFDLFLRRAEPLVPRRLRRTVPERIAADGAEVVPLDEDAVRRAGAMLRAAGVEAVAVAFFNAYRNPEHERRAAEILRGEHPGVSVCAACDVAPEIREYERVSTAVANAYVQPLASRYLRRLADALGTRLLVMLSDGGIAGAPALAAHPIRIVESGPAAGAMIAAHLAAESEWPRALAFDMGGTTAKLSLIHRGVPRRIHAIEVARVHRFKKGSGLPLRLPVVDLMEIGAGGGSVASLDSLGLLKVGPRSAGAMPGPACYGRGGEEPTVTDADLVLGYLAADRFLGGRMRLDRTAADRAVGRLADQLGMGRVDAAAGIHDVVNNNMATAAKVHVAEQGQDPRRYRLVAFGGAGPVHAYGLAGLLHISEVVFPEGAGVASALGMLVAPRSIEYTRSLVCPLDAFEWDAVRPLLRDLEQRARGVLREAGACDADVTIQLAVDMRYVGQGYEVTVSFDPRTAAESDTPALATAFETEYRRRFDRTVPETPVEAISWRLRALSPAVVTRLRLDGSSRSGGRALGRPRPVFFREAGGFVDAPVYRRAALSAGRTIQGPAIVEESEATVVVGPSGVLQVEANGNLVMRLPEMPPHADAAPDGG